jgi:translation initiation factor 4A
MSEENVSQQEPEYKPIEKWDQLEIKRDLLRGIYAYGFENPSPIQQKAIVPMIAGRDILAQAQSGSGKTGTFTVGVLQNIDITIKKTQAIIIAPTHELAEQICGVVRGIGVMFDNLVVKTLFGGTSVAEDAYELKTNTPHVIVGCSGRIFDMIKRKNINVDDIRILALDEADEMLSRGFKEQIYNIFQFLNTNIQVALFSATMPDDVVELSKKFMRNPVFITVKPEVLNLECIQQYYIALQNDSTKYETVKDLFSRLIMGQCVIFVNSVKRAVDLYSAMLDEGFSVICIHSSMTKEERRHALQLFRKGDFKVMISTNLTARGIDVQQVSTVINFDIPKDVHNYLHRIGRSGRWGKKGVAINFVTRHDLFLMKSIERHYQSSIVEMPENISFS